MMRRPLIVLLCVTLPLFSQTEIQGNRIRAHVKFLSSDLLEGRGVGTRGGQIAEEYIAATLAASGVQPAGENHTYFQKVPMMGVTVDPTSKLQIKGSSSNLTLNWQQDWVGTNERQQPTQEAEADLIFAGHGIIAPEENWDDFKGVDVKNKIIVVFTNEPQPDNPAIFKGRTLTYRGRWTYKFEEAARQGALGCIIIHTTPTAGYAWEVVRNSWSKEDPQMLRQPGEPALGLAVWITESAGEQLLRLAGHNVAELLKAADSKDFKPFPLNLRLKADLRAKLRPIESRNVIGIVPGSDAQQKEQAVFFTAHWDHLGRVPGKGDDDIYNGAVDNATGCGVVLETARAWAALTTKPRRSAVFLFVTAEESGLRGSEYYGKHPLMSPAKIALDLNYDAMYPVGRTTTVLVTGADRTTAWPIVQEAARRYDYIIESDPRPEQGTYYRSDHFSLARVGIPAFSIKMGSKVAGKPDDYADNYFRDYNAKRYHQPADEYSDDWDFSGIEHTARFGMLIGLNVANSTQMYTWKEGDEFLKARQSQK